MAKAMRGGIANAGVPVFYHRNILRKIGAVSKLRKAQQVVLTKFIVP
jgi:hypothetical protein